MGEPLAETRFDLENAQGLRNTVRRCVNETPITDLHTHLYAPQFGGLLLYGIDELLTYHYLIAEFFRLSDTPYDAFWAMRKQEQADAIWQCLFVEHSPYSEACRGVITTLQQLGIDPATRNLSEYRAWFNAQQPEDQVERVFRVSNLKCAVMTNDPFDEAERPVWDGGYAGHPLFHAALRIDPLINAWPASYKRLRAWGYDVEEAFTPKTLAEVRRFLEDWVKRMKALYMAVSLPPDFAFPEDSARATLIAECVLPVAREHNIPFALMIGVTRQVNPQLRMAGDGVGTAGTAALEHLCAKYPKNKFMATLLAREDQHALCVTARKFRNLLPFGCWWFLNNPSLIEEMTKMRFEMLGPGVAPQHSDARVLEQVVYKWAHSREIIARVLQHKYADIVHAGWRLTQSEIERDVKDLLDGNFWRFINLEV